MYPRWDSAPTWTRVISRRVAADRETVLNLLAEVELWPALFPHIRSARVLRRADGGRMFRVAARWWGLPLAYTAILTVDADRGTVTIRHLSRLTRDSVATWSVRPAPDSGGAGLDGVELSVHQHVVVPIPIVGGILARELVGGRVARDLGQAKLDRLKEIAEGGSLADRR